jgi:hypothetical protein
MAKKSTINNLGTLLKIKEMLKKGKYKMRIDGVHVIDAEDNTTKGVLSTANYARKDGKDDIRILQVPVKYYKRNEETKAYSKNAKLFTLESIDPVFHALINNLKQSQEFTLDCTIEKNAKGYDTNEFGNLKALKVIEIEEDEEVDDDE